MSSKLAHSPRDTKDLKDAQKRVTDFYKKFGNFVSHASVAEQRVIVRLCRMVLERHSGNLSWEEKPSYWREDVPFADPNNNKKNKSDLKEIVEFLIDEMKMPMHMMEAQNRTPESSSAASGRQDSGVEYRDWDEKDLNLNQRERIKDHLHFFSPLHLDGRLKNRLLAIVDKWTSSQLLIKGIDLELLINKLKLMLGKTPQRADKVRNRLQEFADKESFVSSTLPASVHQLNCEEKQCEEKQCEDAFDNEMCGNKTQEEEKTREEEKTQEVEKSQEVEKTQEEETTWEVDKTREDEKSDEREMPIWDRGSDNSWHPTMESDPDDSEQMVELDLQEDMEKEMISSDSVDCPTDKDENWDSLYRLLEGNVVEGTSEEQTLGPGSQEEADGCEVAQNLLNEVFASILGREVWNDLQKFLMDERKASGVPGIPLSACYKVLDGPKTLSAPDIQPNAEHKKCMVHGVHVHLDNFDTLKLDQQLDYLKSKEFVNRLSRIITQDLFPQCLVPALCEWIASKPNYYDSSRDIFHHLFLEVAPDETLCFSCQKMHREVFFRFTGHNIT